MANGGELVGLVTLSIEVRKNAEIGDPDGVISIDNNAPRKSQATA
jgi:hypothetical protein